MTEPLFFFSYARRTYRIAEGSRFTAAEQNSINAIDEFYRKLCREVVALLPDMDEKDVGFFDQDDLDLSSPWPDRLIDALSTSKVMIALLSPAYFSRPACGREFEVFNRRYRSFSTEDGVKRDHIIIPVTWERPDYVYKSIPGPCREILKEIQWEASGIPLSYKTSGLRRLFEQERRADWNDVCATLAEGIVRLARYNSILSPLDRANFNLLPSAFHDQTNSPWAARPIDRTKREVRVYYLIPTRKEWQECSGLSSQELQERREASRPFNDAPEATVEHATETGVTEIRQELSVIHEPLPDDLTPILDGADNSRTTPILIFDRRAMRVPSLKTALLVYAGGNYKNTGFVTCGGNEISDADIDFFRQKYCDEKPRIENWRLPSGRNDYVKNVAVVIGKLETSLITRRVEGFAAIGSPLPSLTGPVGI